MNIREHAVNVARYNRFLRDLGHTAHEAGGVYRTVSIGQATASLRMLQDGQTVELARLMGGAKDLTRLVAIANHHGFEIFSPSLDCFIIGTDDPSPGANPS